MGGEVDEDKDVGQGHLILFHDSPFVTKYSNDFIKIPLNIKICVKIYCSKLQYMNV